MFENYFENSELDFWGLVRSRNEASESTQLVQQGRFCFRFFCIIFSRKFDDQLSSNLYMFIIVCLTILPMCPVSLKDNNGYCEQATMSGPTDRCNRSFFVSVWIGIIISVLYSHCLSHAWINQILIRKSFHLQIARQIQRRLRKLVFASPTHFIK